jgi:hypothetical protein
MSKQYKIIIPKAGMADEAGGLKLYELGSVVTADAKWKQDLMTAFQDNGWAMEIKVQDTSDLERARDGKGHFVPDDTSTPEVNEAYVKKKAVPKKRKAAPKKKAAPTK